MPTDSPVPSPAITTTPKVDVLRVRTAIQHRFNPVRLATPERMASELDALYLGHLTIARFWEAMQQRDDMIRVADGKRKDSVERMEFQVVVSDDAVTEANMELAQKQKEALGKFYNGLEATDVLRQDMRGGVGLLARQMLDARAKGWSVHEWIWRPRALDGQWTTATFRHCPLYWFENTTGQLRFKASDWDTYGVPMNPREWLVTVADNYMEAMTGAWLYKLDLVRAWVRFCERFGFPLPHAKTPAAKGSKEWDDVVESVEAINEDWGLITNDQVELLLIEAKNTGSNVPFASLVERFDRMIPVIILGSDLSTMSAGSGQGQGASLQAKDDAKREQADAAGEAAERGEYFPRELYKKAADIGLLAIGYPEAYGGIEADNLYRLIVSEEIAQAGSGGVLASLFSHTIGLPPVVALGSEALKQRIVPEVLSGEKIAALAITADDVVLVSTDEICAAIKDVFQDTRSILEPAGALGVAAIAVSQNRKPIS